MDIAIDFTYRYVYYYIIRRIVLSFIFNINLRVVLRYTQGNLDFIELRFGSRAAESLVS